MVFHSLCSSNRNNVFQTLHTSKFYKYVFSILVLFVHDTLFTVSTQDILSRNSDANASEIFENCEDMFLGYCMHNEFTILTLFKTDNTLICGRRVNLLKTSLSI